MELPGESTQGLNPHEISQLSDRDLMEAVYRAIYGERPVHAGIATRVRRLETGFWTILAIVLGTEGLRIFFL